MTGWLEAFAAHPRIGDVEGLKRKFGAFAEMSKGEQALAADTGDDAVFQVGWPMRTAQPHRLGALVGAVATSAIHLCSDHPSMLADGDAI